MKLDIQHVKNGFVVEVNPPGLNPIEKFICSDIGDVMLLVQSKLDEAYSKKRRCT